MVLIDLVRSRPVLFCPWCTHVADAPDGPARLSATRLSAHRAATRAELERAGAAKWVVGETDHVHGETFEFASTRIEPYPPGVVDPPWIDDSLMYAWLRGEADAGCYLEALEVLPEIVWIGVLQNSWPGVFEALATILERAGRRDDAGLLRERVELSQREDRLTHPEDDLRVSDEEFAGFLRELERRDETCSALVGRVLTSWLRVSTLGSWVERLDGEDRALPALRDDVERRFRAALVAHRALHDALEQAGPAAVVEWLS